MHDKEYIKKNPQLYKLFCNLYEKKVIFQNHRKSDWKAIKKFQGKFQGKRCFIIGSGPSLTVSDLDHLKGEYTFASNKIFAVFDKTAWRPTFYVVSDNDITPEMYGHSAKFDSQTQAKFFRPISGMVAAAKIQTLFSIIMLAAIQQERFLLHLAIIWKNIW